MLRYGLRQAGRLALGLLGAVLLAALISALAEPSRGGSFLAFAGHVFTRIVAMGRLDFGQSAISGVPVWSELAKRLPVTLELVGFGAVIAFVAGTPIGILLSAGRALRAGAPLIQLVAAAPAFCAGLGLLWLSERVLHWTGATHEPGLIAALASGDASAIEAELRAIALPALTVGAAGVASVQLALRRTIGEAVAEPYRRGLRALGLGRFEIDRLYLLPQVVAGVLQSFGEIASSLLAAAAVAEWVFDWPGAADLFLRSVALRDWAVVGTIILAFAALTMAAEFVGFIGACALAGTERAA